jgi:ribonuclease P protein component
MTSECFPRRLRLLSATDFKQVFASACKAGNPHLTILVRENGLGHPRLGMAISRKVVRRAVARNRIKRQLREYFRHHQQALGDMDLVILCKPGIDKLDKSGLRDTVSACFDYMLRRCKPA